MEISGPKEARCAAVPSHGLTIDAGEPTNGRDTNIHRPRAIRDSFVPGPANPSRNAGAEDRRWTNAWWREPSHPGATLARMLPLFLNDTASGAANLLNLRRYIDDNGVFCASDFLRDFPAASPTLDTLSIAPPLDPLRFAPNEEAAAQLLERLDSQPQGRALVDCVLAGHPALQDTLPAVDFVVNSSPGQLLAGHRVFAVQHLLGTQLAMFGALEKLGVRNEHIEVVGVPYSTSPVAAYLLARRGYKVDPSTKGYETPTDVPFHERRLEQIREPLLAAVRAAKAAGDKLLILDDGGLCSAILAPHPELADVCVAVEQTTRGITEASRATLSHPVVAVATSDAKALEESPHIGHAIARAIVEEAKLGGMQSGDTVAIVGYGRLGPHIAQAVREANLQVVIVDQDAAACTMARDQGFAAGDAEHSPLEKVQMVVGVTGHRSITPEILRRLPNHCLVASASSAEVEIDVSTFHSASTFGNLHTPHQLHGQREAMFEGRRLVLVNGGRPINFRGHLHCLEPEYIQLTRALMVMGAVHAALAHGKGGVQSLPAKPQEALLAFIKERWRACIPTPTPKLTAAPPEPWEFRGHRDWRRWESYLSRMRHVIPRTEEGRREGGYALYRNAEGTLRLLNYNWGRVSDLPRVPGQPINMEPLDRAQTLILATEENGTAHCNYLQPLGKGWRMVQSHRKQDQLGVIEAGRGTHVFLRQDGHLLAISLDDAHGGLAPVRRRTPDPMANETIQGSVGLVGRTPVILQLGEYSGSFIVWDEDLQQILRLETGLRNFVKFKSTGRGQYVAVGEREDKCLQPVLIDWIRGEVTKLAALPKGSLVRAINFTPHHEDAVQKWTVTYATPGIPDEEAFHGRIEWTTPGDTSPFNGLLPRRA